MEKTLIITADDYGLCAAVNRAVEECLAAGTVGATCVMVNMARSDEAAALRRRFPERSIGIHWNLTQGRPLSPPAAVPTLVDGSGSFAADLRRRWLARKINAGEIRAELRAQYRRFESLAGAADFWNTHQNVHVFPGLFQLFVALALELKIPAMRSHRRITLPAGQALTRYLLTHPGYCLKGWLIARWSAAAQARGQRMPRARLYMPGQQTEVSVLAEIAERLPWHKIAAPLEWVVHPALDGSDKMLGGLTESRRREYQLLTAPSFAIGLGNYGLRPVDFSALAGARIGRGAVAA